MSSTLEGRPRATEARVVFALLALLALVDIGLRLSDAHLSGNLAHVETIPALIEQAGKPDNASMLILGNSLTNNGVAPQIISAQLPDLSIAKATPDATGLWDWECLLDHQVVERSDVQFDTVVIGFAWHLLSDQTRVDASRLGSLYCNLSDLKRTRAIGLQNSGDIGEFIAAKVSRTYALRDTLRNRFFQITVPGYVKFTQASNAARAGQAAKPETKTTTTESQTYTYETFTALVNRLREKGTRVIVLAMPINGSYELDPRLQALNESAVLELVDLRTLPGIEPSHYLDGMHLNTDGQQILSRALADHLAAELASAT